MLQLARLAGSELDEIDARFHLIRDQITGGMLGNAIDDGRQLIEQCRRRRTPHIGGLLAYLGLALALHGDLEEAAHVLLEAVPQNRLAGSLWRVIDVFVLVALLRGRKDSAARLFGVGRNRYATLGHVRQITTRRLHDDALLHLQREIGCETLSRLIKEGEFMTDSDAATLAITAIRPGSWQPESSENGIS